MKQRIYIWIVVSNGSKILIWKQITTHKLLHFPRSRCFQWFKDTNLKANHNAQSAQRQDSSVVSNGSKILIWKQITTAGGQYKIWKCCFQWFKDTNLKANHNGLFLHPRFLPVVSNGSKILIWKQITTRCGWVWTRALLFPMVQRY